MEPSVNVFSSSLWTNLGPTLSNDMVDATFILKRDKAVVKKFEEQLLDLSNPSSKNFRKWLTKEQVIEQMAPPAENMKVLVDFLSSVGLSGENVRISDFRDKFFVKIPAALANSILNTEFARFRSVENKDITLLRVTKPYSLPSDISAVVELVDDILRFPSIRRVKLVDIQQEEGITSAATPFTTCGTKCGTAYTQPAVLQQRYNFSLFTGKTVAKNSAVAVAEFQNQYYDQTDLTNFASACGVQVAVDHVIGGNNDAFCKIGCTEALLDIEYIAAITQPIPLTTVYSATYSLQAWVDSIMVPNPPIYMHSVSYGNDEVQQTSAAYMETCNTEFMKAGALGITIMFASGDQGVWGRSGTGTGQFNPDFPAGSPYITAVGGTDFQVKSTVGAEMAWSCGGGGFSNEFGIPSWQSSNVANYLTTANAAGVLPKASLFNANGRGYPDMAALGGQVNPYCVAVKTGSFGGVAGTSASCPVVAGIFAQLNNILLSRASPTTLGFVNPWLYKTAGPKGCFNDVNDGSLNNCNAGYAGFAALNGWDPATGLGTPNYGCLAANI